MRTTIGTDVEHVLSISGSDWALLQLMDTSISFLQSLTDKLMLTLYFISSVPLVVAIWVFGPVQASEDVFFKPTNMGHWPTTSFALLVGQLSSIYATMGGDATVLLSGDVEAPARTVPVAMVWNYALNAPLTLIMVSCFS